MYAGIRVFHFRPEDIGEYERLVQGGLAQDRLAEVKQLPGFRQVFFLSDAATGTAMGIAMYETEAEARTAATSAAFQRLLSNPELQALLARATAPATRETYRIVAGL